MPVNSTHRAYNAAQAQWQTCRDASAGQDAVHARGASYLPKLSGQTDAEYQAYKQRALYFNATGRTLDGLTGLIFRKQPVFELPSALKVMLTDADTAGTPLTTFAENTLEDLCRVGRFGLLADYTETTGARSLAEEQKLGARPFVVMYPAESVINWRKSKIGGRWQYDLVVLQVRAEKPKDEYTSDCVDQWHVLSLKAGVYTIEVFEKSKETGKTEQFVLAEPEKTPLMAGKKMSFIPFLFCNPRGVSDEIIKSPILDIADVNLSHYRTTADYEHGLHFTGLPTPYVTGHTFGDGESLALGASVVTGFPSDKAKLGFLEFTGDGLSNLSTRLEEKEQMMVVLGARLLASEKRQVEAAETAAIHRAGENSVLASMAIAAGLALTQALQWCAQFARADGAVSATFNADFLPAGLSAQELSELVKAWQAGAISHETLYDNMQRGEVAQQGVSFDEEKQRIEEAGPPLADAKTDAIVE